MAHSSSQKPFSPEITPKEEPVTLDKPKSPNPLLLADQVEFIFEEIAFTTNNEVALLYPSHPNSDYFREVSNFISKCYLKEALPGGIRGDIGINIFRNDLRARYLPYSSTYVSPPSITIARPWFTTTGKKPGAKSRLKRKQSSKHTSESQTEASKSKTGQSKIETKSSLAKDKSTSHPSPPTPMVDEIHKEAKQVAGVLTSLRATSEEGAYPQLNSGHDASADSTAEADLGISTQAAFFTPDSPQDDPIIVTNNSEKEKADKEDTHDTSHDVPEDTSVLPPPYLKSAQIQELMAQVQLPKSQKAELEQQKATTEAEVALLKARPSYLDVNQLTTLLVADLKNIQWELLVELQALPVLVSSVQKQLKTLDSLLSLLNKVTETLKRFATMVENSSQATTKDVPSASQVTASPAEGEKNTKDVETNLKDELVDLLGKNVMTRYYNKKLLFDKYCDKMLKRKKSHNITNCEVLTKKGPITLKIYREDGSEEVISYFKVSNLHLTEWREVIQACLNKSEKGWKTIYDLVKTRLDQLTQTEQELKIDLNKPLKKQDRLNELNELANKKRKRTSDLKDHYRSTKKHKSSSST
nr:hypothetical protein [Tanacetum cinerariifolium]